MSRTDDGIAAAHRHVRAVLVASAVTFSLLQSLVVPVLPQIANHLGSETSTTTWVVTVYLLFAALSAALLGPTGDAIGRARVLRWVLLCVAVGSVVSALAPSLPVALAGRALQGAAGALIPLAFGIAREGIAGDERRAISLLAAVSAVGFGLGLVAAGPVYAVLGYHGLFAVPAATSGAIALTARRVLPSDSSDRRRAEMPSAWAALFMSVWLVALLAVLSKGAAWGWLSVPTTACAAAIPVFFAAWHRADRRAAVPLVDLAVIRSRTMMCANVVAALLGFTALASWSYLPQYVQASGGEYGFGLDVLATGLLLLPQTLVAFVAGLATTHLVARWGNRAVLATGCSLAGLAFAMLARWHAAPWQVAASGTVQGVGSGVVFVALAGLVVTSVSATQAAAASATNANIRTLGAAAGSAVAAAMLAPGPASASQYQHVFTTMVLTMVAGCLLCLTAIPPKAG